MDDPLLTTTTVPPEPSPAGDDDAGIDWSLCTWKGSRREQHRTYLALPFRRKLELLEELCDHARFTLEDRRRRGLPYLDPYTGEVVRPPVPPAVAGAGDGPAQTLPWAG